jgi:hypothetical protein
MPELCDSRAEGTAADTLHCSSLVWRTYAVPGLVASMLFFLFAGVSGLLGWLCKQLCGLAASQSLHDLYQHVITHLSQHVPAMFILVCT